MEDLITIPTDISFGILVQPLMAQLPQVIAFGKQVTALAANSALLNIVATFLFLAACAELTTSAPNPTRLTIPASNFAAASTQPTASSSNCPGQLPNCSNCGGNKNPPSNPINTNGICVGLPQHKNFAAGCPCVDPDDPPIYAPYANIEAINAAQVFLNAVAENALNATQGIGGASSMRGSVTVSASTSPASSFMGGLSTITESSSRSAKPKNCGIQPYGKVYIVCPPS